MYSKILTPLFYLIFISASVAQINCPNGQSGYPIVQGFDYAPSKDNTWSPLIVGDIGHNNSGQITAGKWGFKNTSGKNKTGPNTPYNGSYYLTYRSNNPAPDGLSAKANVDLDLTSFTDDAELSFYLYAYGTGIGDLKVNIDNDATDNFESFVTLQVYSGQIQDSKTEPWELKQISLQNYLGNKVTIQFEYKDLDIVNNGDIALDFLRVETCGDVCVPGQVVFSNEQYNSVDFDWSPSGNQTNIQYSVSDADATSQEGTIVDLANAANQTVSLSNLEKLTTYALWVRSECTSGYSDWEKFLFTTAEQYNYVVSPGEIVTVSYVKCEVPEGISPNGDAYNQYFDLSTFGVKRLEVYNRYGKLVYSKNNYKKEWFGQDSGNGALPTGTYFYIITFNDNSKPKTGSVYINR